MTMRTASPLRSPCEILRLINDRFQGDTDLDRQIRLLCAEGEKGTKRLAQELNKYKKEAWKGWWSDNPKWRDLLDGRLNDNYKQEGSK